MKGLTLGHIAERNARKWPEREAVVEQSETGERLAAYTFEEFNNRVDRLANALAERGINQGDAVGFYMKNNAETLEAFVSVMKLGALPVPINHRFKGEEVKYVLRDSVTKMCLIDSFGAETMEKLDDDPEVPVENFLYVGENTPAFAESYEETIAATDDTPIDITTTALDEAGIMYTSGTTGDPKGCIYTHSNITALAWDGAYTRDYLEPGNRHLIITPLFHVGGFVPFIYNFHVGGTTVVVEGFDPELTLELFETESINSTYLVPTQGRSLLESTALSEYDHSHLVDISIGGAPVGAELKQKLMQQFDCGVTESFGQTEALALILPSDVALEKPESVGRTSLSFEAKVVDPETGEELPSGEAGQIAYRGPTVFKEYHNMPEKTDEVFDNGWFVSGDLVERDEDGYFYFIGRSDNMIITGGENVHPAEIEDVLQEYPKIIEVAVIGVSDEKWGERIKACIVPDGDTTLSAEEVIDYVDTKLASYKRPREVEFYDELPRNPTGKVLKSELN